MGFGKWALFFVSTGIFPCGNGPGPLLKQGGLSSWGLLGLLNTFSSQNGRSLGFEHAATHRPGFLQYHQQQHTNRKLHQASNKTAPRKEALRSIYGLTGAELLYHPPGVAGCLDGGGVEAFALEELQPRFKELDAELVHIIVVPRPVDDVVKVAQLNGKPKCRSS